MLSFKKFALAAASSMAFLIGCGDDSSSTSVEQIPDPGASVPVTPVFSVTSCEEVTDKAVINKLSSAKANIADAFQAIAEGDFKHAQTVSGSNKAIFKEVLVQYPGNCEAQLGYAVSIITDLVNNKDIKALIDTISNKQDLMDIGIDDATSILVNGDGTKFTSQIQKAVASAIPSVDSAIIYMTNIVGDENFVCSYTYEEKTYELDRGEFAPALASLYVAKSILTMAASLNIDFSDNGKYDWIDTLDQYDNYYDNKGYKHIISLMDPSSMFSTVYDDWKGRYQNIPSLLDTAISYVQIGLQYGIDESKKGLEGQSHDLYIVGDDEFSDVSPRDLAKAIDSLEHYRAALHDGVDITFENGKVLKVNLAKFFNITDGFQDYFPYHVFNESSEWSTPVEGFFWTDNLYGHESYAEEYIETETCKKFMAIVPYTNLIECFSGYYDISENRMSIYFNAWDEEEENNIYLSYDLSINNCVAEFTESPYSDETSIDFSSMTKAITLPSTLCKVEKGASVFATAYDEVTPNFLYFTDKSGKKTITIQGLANGKVTDNGWKPYTINDFKKFIFFPDPTFGGVFPGMTNDLLWDWVKYFKDLDEESDDYYDDYDYYGEYDY